MGNATKQPGKISDADKTTLEGLLVKVYDAGGEPAIESFVKSKGKNMPPIKLSHKEMEMIKGGNFLEGFGIGAGAGLAICAGLEIAGVAIT